MGAAIDQGLAVAATFGFCGRRMRWLRTQEEAAAAAAAAAAATVSSAPPQPSPAIIHSHSSLVSTSLT